MPIVKESSGGDFKIPSAGMQIGVCYRVIDLGTQKKEYQGDIKFKREILIQWELPEEMVEDKPMVISKFVTLAAGEKAVLTKIVQASLGVKLEAGFDTAKLLTTACNLNIVHNTKPDGSVKAQIDTFAPLKKSEKAPAPYNPIMSFDLDNFDAGIFGQLSEGIQQIIKRSPEYVSAISGKEVPSFVTESLPVDDMIPF